MFFQEEKVEWFELPHVLVKMLMEGSLIHKNVEISLELFDENKASIHNCGGYLLGARDAVLGSVICGEQKAEYIPFAYENQQYHVSYQINLN